MASAPQILPQPPRRLKERYKLLKLVGQGGTGAVYKARDLELDRIIALKLLHPMLANDQHYVNFLKREVVISSQLSHPNIVRVFDVGQIHKVTMITMAFVQGESLGSILHRDGALSTPRIVHFCRDICAGLAEAHRCGVVHRDLKPQNLLVDHQSRVLISDFGLAYAANSLNYDAIESSTRPGTLRYMSPEQFHALGTDARSDLFSFGLILYEMLTGSALEVDHDVTGPIAIDAKTGFPVTLPAGVHASLGAIALRCLAQNPEERFQSAEDILESLPDTPFPAIGAELPSLATGTQPTARKTLFQRAEAIWYRTRWRTAMEFRSLFERLSAAVALGTLLFIPLAFYNPSLLGPVNRVYQRAATKAFQQDLNRSLQRATAFLQTAASRRAITPVTRATAPAKFRPHDSDESLADPEIDEKSDEARTRVRARSLLLSGGSAQALAIWQNAIQADPYLWLNHNGYGVALMAAGRPAEAQAEFREAIRLNSSSYVGYSNLGAAYIAAGDFHSAIAAAEKSLTLRKTAMEYNNLGQALYYTGACTAAIAPLRKAWELNPGSAFYAGNLAAAYGCSGDGRNSMRLYHQALQLARPALGANSANQRIQARACFYLVKLGRTDEAQAELATLQAASPVNPNVLYVKAIVELAKNEISQATASVVAALGAGYPVRVAAHDPELMPLWADAELKKRFVEELGRERKSESERSGW